MTTVISNSNSIAARMVAIVISKSSRQEEFLFHHCTAKDRQGPAQHRPSNGSSIKISSRDSLFSALPRNLWWCESKACHPPTFYSTQYNSYHTLLKLTMQCFKVHYHTCAWRSSATVHQLHSSAFALTAVERSTNHYTCAILLANHK